MPHGCQGPTRSPPFSCRWRVPGHQDAARKRGVRGQGPLAQSCRPPKYPQLFPQSKAGCGFPGHSAYVVPYQLVCVRSHRGWGMAAPSISATPRAADCRSNYARSATAMDGGCTVVRLEDVNRTTRRLCCVLPSCARHPESATRPIGVLFALRHFFRVATPPCHLRETRHPSPTKVQCTGPPATDGAGPRYGIARTRFQSPTLCIRTLSGLNGVE